MKGIEGRAGKIRPREADAGERGQREFGEIDVVEADNGEILGHAEACQIGRAENADGGHVVGTDEGGGTRGELVQLLEARNASLQRVIALDDPFLLQRQAGGLHGGAEVVLARDGRVQAVRAGQKGNGTVAELGKVANGAR